MIRHKALLAATALVAASLSACAPRSGVRSVAGLCPDWKTPPAAGDAAAPVDDCVKRWAYTLAGTADDSEVVAEAVMAACEPSLARWNQAGLASPPEGEAISITTGQPTNPLAEHYSFAQSHALLYVIQARAGRCSAPQVKDGAPVGIAAS